ncbi:hypothetical protein PILCRDRAFT_821813 [Piloderma croceum F 1598]|uniref:Mitochondrial K+-H+ exchange-related-domain-containing protein n=1 Tax=Piloderma croceum (strain F 1598) TaxID=765440 RepID=A0A0C3FP08_PILCF|nr:hypothetical protein PILCRDRAFT_821813 [Piloderma croceum F 1598]
MSVVPKIIRPMRIIALPLTRAAILPTNHSPTNEGGIFDPTLTFYHFQLRSPPGTGLTDRENGKKQGRIKSLVTWVSTKAADTWAGFGRAPEGNWKLRTYQYGERLVDRMDFEELALKGVDPSLGPSITHPQLGSRNEKLAKEAQSNGKTRITIPLVYPPIAHPAATPSTTPHPSLIQLQALLANRKPRHRKGFYTWMMIAPFTAPFMIVPIIPNLPFFFCVWRSWSHYRAYRASQYLENLIDQGAIVPEASEELDKIYAEHDPLQSNTTTSPSDTNTTNPHSSPDSTANPEPAPPPLLLTRAAIPAIVSLFNLTGHSSADMYRALEQARLRSADVGSTRK